MNIFTMTIRAPDQLMISNLNGYMLVVLGSRNGYVEERNKRMPQAIGK